jgi:hypothetical protein
VRRKIESPIAAASQRSNFSGLPKNQQKSNVEGIQFPYRSGRAISDIDINDIEIAMIPAA